MTDNWFWSRLPGLNRKVKWPVQMLDGESEKVTVFCQADQAYFSVDHAQLEPFPGQLDKLKQKCIAALTKQPKTLKAFLGDIDFALEHSRDETPTAGQVTSPLAGQDTSLSAGQDTLPSAGQDTSPYVDQDISPTAGQDTSPSAGQVTSPSAGQDTSPSIGQDTLPSAGQDTSPSAGQDTSQLAGQDISPLAGRDTTPSAGQDTSPSTGQDTAPSVGQDILLSAGQDTSPSAGQDTSPLTDQYTSSSAGKDTSPLTGQYTSPSAGKDTSPSTGQTSSPSAGQDTSPKAGQDTPLSAGQDTSSSDGQDTPLSAGQDTSPKAGQDTSLSAGQDTSSSVGQDTSLSAGQDTSSSAGQDTSLSAGQDTLPSAGQDTLPFVGQYSSPSTTQDTSPKAGQDTPLSAGQDTSSSVGQDTPLSAGQDTSSSVGQDTSLSVGQDTSSSAGQDTSLSAGQDTLSSVGQDTSLSAGQDTSSSAGQDTSLSAGQDTLPSAGQDTLPFVGQYSSPSTTQDTSPSASQDISSSAGQDTPPSAGQDTSPTVGQVSWPSSGQDTLPSSQDSSPSAGQDTTPSAGQDTSPSVGQDTSPSVGQDTSPSASQDACDNMFEDILFSPEISSSEHIVYSSDPGENFDGLDEDYENVHMTDIIDLIYNDGILLDENADVSENESTCSIEVPLLEHTDELVAMETEDESETVARDDEEMKDYDTNEAEKLRDKKKPEIYVLKVLKSAVNKSKQKKTKDRVYNSKHSCFFCDKLVLHIRAHLTSRHKQEELVQTALKDKTGAFMSLLRSKGNDKHNNKVIAEGHGLLLISRRPTKELDSEQYGPCIHCREWMIKSTLKRHQSKCIAQRVMDVSPLSKRNLIMQSDILSGRLETKASSLLQKEVFTIMTRDTISEIAQKDHLIVALGESWLRRNIDNKLKRKYYASQRMRLNARLLSALREEDTTSDAKSMWEFLVPQMFDSIAKAAITIAIPTMEDEEDLRSPSNAIKLKYDVIRLVNAKWCLSLKENNELSKHAISDCKGLMKLIGTEWPEKVTRFARMVLAQRQREVTRHIPAPDDIKLLNEHLSAELKTTAMRKQLPDFQRVVKLVQTKLLLYNKRRSGEIDAVSLRDYAKRSINLNEVDQSLVGELSELEKYLLTSQELMTLRGKRNRPVPCIIPSDAIRCLSFISNAEVRAAVGINKNNTYLFASSGQYNVRAYDSLKATCSELNLNYPDRITSVNLRKYTATLSQVLNLKPNELQWLCSHLGHTTRVHLEHYRQMSGFIERVSISKLLLIQDMNLSRKFVGKSLSEIDEIPLEDILKTGPDDKADHGAGDNAEIVEANKGESRAGREALHPPEEEYVNMGDDDYMMLDAESSEEEDFGGKRKRAAPKKAPKRQKFSQVETEEINNYFEEYLKSGICPRTKTVEEAKRKSHKKNGEIWKRSCDKIIKKISAMNHKQK